MSIMAIKSYQSSDMLFKIFASYGEELYAMKFVFIC